MPSVDENLRTCVVVNPRSQGGATERNWGLLSDVIRKHFGPFEVRFTSGPGDGKRQARGAIDEGFEMVVAMGGDGTISEVADGFIEGETPVRKDAVLGVLPAGTGGDFRRTLGLPKTLPEAASALRGKKTAAIDLGRLEFTGHDGKPEVRHFINIASFGIGGLVDKYVNQSSKALGGTLSFALATLKAGLDYKNANVRVVIDGAPPREGRIYNIAVANGRYFGGGMKVAPDAALDDGWFDVVTLGDFGFTDLVFRGLDIYSGKHLKNPKVTVHRARKIEATPIDGSAEVLLDVDGEAPGRLPATFVLLEGALKVRAKA